MMVRTQISLNQEMHRRARERAHGLGISLSEYIRRVVAGDLSEPRPSRPGREVFFDLGDGGKTDIAREKDRLIAEATGA